MVGCYRERDIGNFASSYRFHDSWAGGEMINIWQSDSGAKVQVAPDPAPDKMRFSLRLLYFRIENSLFSRFLIIIFLLLIKMRLFRQKIRQVFYISENRHQFFGDFWRFSG